MVKLISKFCRDTLFLQSQPKRNTQLSQSRVRHNVEVDYQVLSVVQSYIEDHMHNVVQVMLCIHRFCKHQMDKDKIQN